MCVIAWFACRCSPAARILPMPCSASDLFRIVKMVMERNYDPVIVFSFSKRECEQFATQMSKLDFTTEEEKKCIEAVFVNAMDALSDDDRQLPQVVRAGSE